MTPAYRASIPSAPPSHAITPLLSIPPKRLAMGVAVGLVSFLAIGTITALWNNPFFVRMTPAGAWEIGALTVLSMLAGVYAALRRAACGGRTAGAGGVLGFLGVACPVCNKVLLLLFGSQLLMSYFEPVRIYVAAAGLFMLAGAIALEYRRQLGMLRISAAALAG
jgi:hypothetical protein